METHTDTNLTKDEAQFILDQIKTQGVPFGHPNGQYVLAVGDSVVAKMTAIVEANGTSE